MSVEQPQLQDANYKVPKWAGIISWMVPLACCAVLVWMRETPWTKGTVPGLVLTYIFGWMWIRMAVRLVRGEPIPNFLRKPVIGTSGPTGWLDSPRGTLLQTSLLLAAGIVLAIL
jgi:hypothetical protein